MKPVLQTVFYDPSLPPRGNCLAAVVASLLELPIDAVPDFVQDDTDHKGDPEWDWWMRLCRFVTEHGHQIIYPLAEPEPGEFYAVTGMSPRNPRLHHVVIYRDGQMVHDPHPDGTGLVKITDEAWSLRKAAVLAVP